MSTSFFFRKETAHRSTCGLILPKADMPCLFSMGPRFFLAFKTLSTLLRDRSQAIELPQENKRGEIKTYFALEIKRRSIRERLL